MEDQILSLLRQKAAQGHDQGLEDREIAQQLDLSREQVLTTLQALQANGLAHKESFYWYPGPALDLGPVDQT